MAALKDVAGEHNDVLPRPMPKGGVKFWCHTYMCGIWSMEQVLLQF